MNHLYFYKSHLREVSRKKSRQSSHHLSFVGRQSRKFQSESPYLSTNEISYRKVPLEYRLSSSVYFRQFKVRLYPIENPLITMSWGTVQSFPEPSVRSITPKDYLILSLTLTLTKFVRPFLHLTKTSTQNFNLVRGGQTIIPRGVTSLHLMFTRITFYHQVSNWDSDHHLILPHNYFSLHD